MNKRGFTLVEMVVAMTIISIIMALSAAAFKRVVLGTRTQTKSVQSGMDKIMGLGLVRLDLEHVGFGIASDETSLPIVWNEGAAPVNRKLTLRSTLNNSNQDTMGWMLLNCSSGATIGVSTIVDRRENAGNKYLVLLDEDKKYVGGATAASYVCPAVAGVYSAYPYDNTVTDGCTGSQVCNQVVYELGTTQSLSSCATGTRQLLRKVGGGSGVPVLNCVADFLVRFDLDTNGDGTVDISDDDGTNLPATTANVITQVKSINTYVLMQMGQRDRELTFTGDTTMGGAIPLDNSGVTDFTQYRWKVLKLSGKPMSWE